MSCDPRIRELLPAWAAGELEAAESQAVERHLESCPECRELADRLAAIQAAVEPLRDPEPPRALTADLTSTACERWRLLLFSAMDGAVDEDELEPLLEHLDNCPTCTAVWTALTTARSVLAPLQPPPRLLERCRRIPWAARRRRIPGVRTAAAAAYVLAVAVSLLLGNPVTLARQEMSTAARSVGRTVEAQVQEVKEDGRGELRLVVWKIWRFGEHTVDAIHRILVPEPENDNPRKGEST